MHIYARSMKLWDHANYQLSRSSDQFMIMASARRMVIFRQVCLRQFSRKSFASGPSYSQLFSGLPEASQLPRSCLVNLKAWPNKLKRKPKAMTNLERNDVTRFNGATTLCISMNAPHNFFDQFAQKTLDWPMHLFRWMLRARPKPTSWHDYIILCNESGKLNKT